MLTRAIIGELRAIVGDPFVMTDKEDLFAYSNDATIFNHLPDAVVRPANRDEVAAVVKVAARHKIPLTPRGAATCLSGGAVPLKGGIVVDLA
ncbi:MAG TPA: FAD-binding protein, partial [Negativicutes bacterium]|nr:FAD-binding protein [Negativicutes bacterium]